MLAHRRRPAAVQMVNLCLGDSGGVIKRQLRRFDWRRRSALDLPPAEFFQSLGCGLYGIDQGLHGLV